MNNKKITGLKILGFATTIAGVVVSMLTSYVDAETRKEEIREEVSKQLSEREEA